ncbi:MAG: DUF5615 family PIN-like protein, partial [Chloroflexi bacterium]|nr:DUF5615 family PIN-like protein [Chloroflexota bacterium]
NISPRTIQRLRSLGHDVVPADSLLPANAPDEAIVAMALQRDRVILTHDMDFSAIIARSGLARPSLISLRLARAGSAYVKPNT